MVSSSLFYTLLFAMGFFLLIGSIHAASVHNKDSSDDSTLLKAFDDDQDETRFYLSKHRLASRGARLPSESILLGKRRLPVEAVLLGRRDVANEVGLYGKRR